MGERNKETSPAEMLGAGRRQGYFHMTVPPVGGDSRSGRGDMEVTNPEDQETVRRQMKRDLQCDNKAGMP